MNDDARQKKLFDLERLKAKAPDMIPVEKVVEMAGDELKNCEPPGSDLINSIDRFGIIYPIIFTDDGIRGPILRAGRRRILAALKLELKNIPVIIYDNVHQMAGLVLSVHENEARKPNIISTYISLCRIKRVADDTDLFLSDKELAVELGITVSRLRRVQAFDNLYVELLDAAVNGEIAVTTAERLAKKSDEFQKESVKWLKEHGRLTGSDVTHLSTSVRQKASKELPTGRFEEIYQGARVFTISEIKDAFLVAFNGTEVAESAIFWDKIKNALMESKA